MKKQMVALLAALGLAALVCGGCANKESLVGETPAPATVKAETPKPVKQPYFKAEEPPAAVSQKQVGEVVPAAPVTPVPAVVKPAEVSEFETVYFDFDKADLRQDARNVLAKNAEILLKSKKSAKIKIEGHCDERGSAEYNIALGERRAKSALQYLITLGVQSDRLSFISYGKEKPAVQGNDEAAWAKNRRAEFTIDK